MSGFPPPPKAAARLAEARSAREGGSRDSGGEFTRGRDVEIRRPGPTTSRTRAMPALRPREQDMKYMLMMSGTKADFDWYAKWSKEDLSGAGPRACVQQGAQGVGPLRGDRRAWVSERGQGRACREERRAGTDGVFPESKEFLAGYWIVDVETADQAYRIAARASAAPGPGGTPANMPIEVRQVMSSIPDDILR